MRIHTNVAVVDAGSSWVAHARMDGAWEGPRRADLTASLIAGELCLARQREYGAKPFAVGDIGLANLTQAVEHGSSEALALHSGS
jgi:hypothetical protein